MSGSAAFFRAANLLLMDYPYAAALASALRICDEACVVVGQSVDESRDAVYALQAQYGRDRIKIREETFVFDRNWQERWWNWCRQMTTADWHMYIDADEIIHEDDAPAIRALLDDSALQAIVFPMVHLYATANFRGDFAMRHNARLGRASAGYRMRNWCSNAHPTHAACQMVIERHGEINAHKQHDAAVAWVDVPVVHYGWCRTAQALAISQAKHTAWYADGAGLEDGRVPDVAPYDFRLAERLREGWATPYTGPHAQDMREWMDAHSWEWSAAEVF